MPSNQARLASIGNSRLFSLIARIIICTLISTQSLVGLVYLSSLMLSSPAQAEDQNDHEENEDDNDIPSRVQIIHGVAHIHLTPEEQSQSGLISQQLATSHYLPEQRSYGKVVNIQGLIKLRSDYQVMRSQRAIAESTFKTAQQNYQRLKQLHQEAIIPTHKLQLAKSDWQSAQIKVNASDAQLQMLRITAEQSWGQTLTDWALEEHSPAFQQLLTQQQVLMMISLKANQSLLEDTSFIFIARDSDRQQAHKAYLISAAPQTGTASQGETYFFRSTREHLRIGMQIHAWIPKAGQYLTGVTIPASAVVWQGGKPWVYLQTDAEHFSRHPIPEHHPQTNGRFVSLAVFRQQPIVIIGAQMLLSEEFRWQIPEEDDD